VDGNETWLTRLFAAAMARRSKEVIRRASASTKPSSSESGSARLTYPYRSAVSPSKSFAPIHSHGYVRTSHNAMPIICALHKTGLSLPQSDPHILMVESTEHGPHFDAPVALNGPSNGCILP